MREQLRNTGRSCRQDCETVPLFNTTKSRHFMEGGILGILGSTRYVRRSISKWRTDSTAPQFGTTSGKKLKIPPISID